MLLALLAGFLPVAAMVTIRGNRPGRDRYVPRYQVRGGGLKDVDEINLVLIISSHCTLTSDFAAAIETMKLVLSHQAAAQGLGFGATAVVVDWSPVNAGKFIKRLGRFDELLVGRSWLNAGVIDHIWREPNGTPTVPQVLVVRRSIHPTTDRIEVGPDSVLVRQLGNDQIVSWVAEGMSLVPSLSFPPP